MPYYHYYFYSQTPKLKKITLILKSDNIYDAQSKAIHHIKNKSNYSGNFESYNLVLSYIQI